ncbi:hypothetical protein Q3G72_029601 [Acer saccharum]|nr:hypothetical protein Q3G72_029601 [Acer saccharum]
MSTDAQKIHFIWHWPHGDVLSDLKFARTPGMAPVEDGTARFLELLEAIRGFPLLFGTGNLIRQFLPFLGTDLKDNSNPRNPPLDQMLP